MEVKDKDKCTSYIASSSLNNVIKANADTLCTGGTDTNGNTIQSLVVFDDISSSNYETAGLEVNYIVINNIKIKDKDKCVAYLIESWNDTSDEGKQDANTLCSGNALDDGYTLKDEVHQGYILSSDYETAGLEVTSKPYTVEEEIIITGYNVGTRNIVVKDKDRCASYLTSKFNYTEDMTTDLCVNNTSESEVALLDIVPTLGYLIAENLIPSTDYVLAGLEVTYKNGGGTDVVIPSMIDGKKVVGIASYAFTKNGVAPTTINNTKKTSVSYLYNIDNKNEAMPLAYIPIGLGITSVIIPNTVTGIGNYAFKDNKLIEVTIPSSVIYIGSGAFQNNRLTKITIPKSVTNIGAYAFADNRGIIITNNSSIENSVDVWDKIVGAGSKCGNFYVDSITDNVIKISQNTGPC